MNRRNAAGLVLICGAAAAGGWLASGRAGNAGFFTPSRVANLHAGVTPRMADVDIRDRDIAFFEKRVREDPESALDFGGLAAAYLQRGRETDNDADFRNSEAAARRSLSLRTAHNDGTAAILALSLIGLHRFGEAREVALWLIEREPNTPAYRAILGDIQFELGDYDGSRATFAKLQRYRRNLSVAPGLARLAEISGHTEESRRILRQAVADAAENKGPMPVEQVAWLHLRLGDLELRAGRLERAEHAFREGLKVEPNDFRLLAGMMRLEAARNRWKRVVTYGERVGAAADLATTAILGDAYAALGDSTDALRSYALAERRGVELPEPYNRQWYTFLLDHDRRLPEALALLREEITSRRDVPGYDLLGWALYKSGNYRDAQTASRRALRMGTKDATYFFHAGMIERSLGNGDAARRYLSRALELNPHFHHSYPAAARAVLDSLGARPSA